MKAVRSPLATALVVVVTMLIGCGLDPGPSAPRFTPPAGTYNEHQWVSVENPEGQLYMTTDPDLGVLEFEPISDKDPIFVGDDLTIRAYVIDYRGLRSPVSVAAYVIEDIGAPVISSGAIWQTSVDYFGYDLAWDAWPADASVDGTPNPSDDLTDWYNLEFAVYASPDDNIDTPADAESNGTLLRDWFSKRDVEDSWNDRSPDNDLNDVGYAYCSASQAGERRYINVFVRDQEGNTSAYGSVRMESRFAPPDIYLGLTTPPDEVWFNPVDGAFDPVFTNPPSPPPVVLANTYAVALADLNDDGFDDLIACYQSLGTVYQAWFAAVGNGTFSDTPNHFKVGSAVATEIGIADINLDGRMDVVFANTTTNVAVYDADLSLLFAVSVTGTDRISLGDINGDQYPDLVTADVDGAEKVRIWMNQAGTSMVEEVQTWFAEIPNPVDVLLSDLDRDGLADLVVARDTPNWVEIFYSNGATLVAGPAEDAWWMFERTIRLAALDWNGDGWQDLILGNDTTGVPNLETRLYLSDKAYGFLFTPGMLGSGSQTADLAIADVNGDGWPDFIEASTLAAAQVWLNDAGGMPIAGFSAGAGHTSLAVGRLR